MHTHRNCCRACFGEHAYEQLLDTLHNTIYSFPKSVVHVNDDHSSSVDASLSNGVVHVCRLALRTAYPTLANQGSVDECSILFVHIPSQVRGRDDDTTRRLRVASGAS